MQRDIDFGSGVGNLQMAGGPIDREEREAAPGWCRLEAEFAQIRSQEYDVEVRESANQNSSVPLEEQITMSEYQTAVE